MRTTLDIDADVLQAAKEIAAADGKTAGEILSDLARKGLTSRSKGPEDATAEFVVEDGWVTLLRRGDAIVTTELVERLLEQADFEDAGLRPPED